MVSNFSTNFDFNKQNLQESLPIASKASTGINNLNNNWDEGILDYEMDLGLQEEKQHKEKEGTPT